MRVLRYLLLFIVFPVSTLLIGNFIEGADYPIDKIDYYVSVLLCILADIRFNRLTK